MSTVRDLIRSSLRLIGAVATGENPSADEQADALSVLNRMVDSWSTEGLLIFAKVREEFDLIPSKQAYTIGTGGDFDTVRPQKIEHAALLLSGSNNFEIPIDVINSDQWADITTKSIQSAIPTKLYVEGTFPLETLNLWPIPSQANKIILYSQKPLMALATANTAISLPPGYEDALVNNLAVRLAPEYGKPIDPNIQVFADDSKANIKRANIKPAYLDCDVALTRSRSGFNYLTGE